MDKKIKIKDIPVFLIIVLGLTACLTEDEVNELKYKPVTVVTAAATSVTANSAIAGGTISAPQQRNVIRGVCWSTSPNPEITLATKTTNGTGLGRFTTSITGLTANTTYYVRAYATSSLSTVYGYQAILRTSIPVLASVSTNALSAISNNTATCGGQITSDGGVAVTTRGVCWSTSTNPTISDSKTSDGTGSGSFTSSLTGLVAGTTYYVRAYATNSVGTAYGSQVIFNTLSITLPTVSTSTISLISPSGCLSGGSITSDGGATVTARGVCWSTGTSPTIINNKTSDGTGIGSYQSTITELIPGTIYYVRAYATNSIGTAYGSNVSFTTNSILESIPTVLIPAGTFTMGSPINEAYRSSEETQHQVTLSAFRMSKFEITNTQYAAFLNAKGVGFDGKDKAGMYPTQTLIYNNSLWGVLYNGNNWVAVTGYENSPVINVTWYGANEFAAYVGGSLPTEAQWEYACRAGTTTPFNTGNCLTNLQANYNWTYPYSTCSNTITTSPNKPKAIGTYAPNSFGLYDMHGNVYEWCCDWYSGTYPVTAQTNPTGATTGWNRIYRGGGWNGGANGCRSAARSYGDPIDNSNVVGFRLVFIP